MVLFRRRRLPRVTLHRGSSPTPHRTRRPTERGRAGGPATRLAGIDCTLVLSSPPTRGDGELAGLGHRADVTDDLVARPRAARPPIRAEVPDDLHTVRRGETAEQWPTPDRALAGGSGRGVVAHGTARSARWIGLPAMAARPRSRHRTLSFLGRAQHVLRGTREATGGTLRS
jgi:hypothetical protein